MQDIIYLLNKAAVEEIIVHLSSCSKDYTPPLEDRVKITEYAEKLFFKSTRFEAWNGSELIGLVAVYSDFEKRKAFITNVSVLHCFSGMGIGTKLMDQCINYLKEKYIGVVYLEVAKENQRARDFYKKKGFICRKHFQDFCVMTFTQEIYEYKI